MTAGQGRRIKRRMIRAKITDKIGMQRRNRLIASGFETELSVWSD